MLLPLLLLFVGLGNLIAGIWLLIRTEDCTNIILALLSVGFTLSIIFILICIIRPKSIMEWPGFVKRLFAKRVLLKRRRRNVEEVHCLNPENAEIIMRNLRGIPFLIQAIQYSMETTCLSNNSNSALRTAVIHTAPACHNILEASDDSPEPEAAAPRAMGFEELWTPVNSSLWNNVQLNLSLNSGDSEFSVFPYSETNSLRRPQGRSHVEEFIKGTKSSRSSLRRTETTTSTTAGDIGRNSFQV